MAEPSESQSMRKSRSEEQHGRNTNGTEVSRPDFESTAHLLTSETSTATDGGTNEHERNQAEGKQTENS